MAILLIIIIIILCIFLAGKLIEDFGETIGLLIGGIAALFSKIKKAFSRKRKQNEPREVIVSCPCLNEFRATPQMENGWIVRCPACGKQLRVNTGEKEPEKRTKRKK